MAGISREKIVIFVGKLTNRFREPLIVLPKSPAGPMPHEPLASCRWSVQVGAATRTEIVDRLVCQGIEPTIKGILFELSVPSLGVESVEPLAEGSEVCSRKPSDSLFNFVNRAHCTQTLLGCFDSCTRVHF